MPEKKSFKDFRFHTKFSSEITATKVEKEEALSLLRRSEANIKNLSSLLPAIDADENPDLLAISCNAAVVNLINGNDDGILTDTALAVTPKFKNKPINVEHMRNWVVGHITSAGYSSFSDSSVLTAEQIGANNLSPFNISLGGIIYKTVDESLAEVLEESQIEGSPDFMSYSTSWELGFDSYVLALGSKRLQDAEIVDDEMQIKELTKYLRAEGGTGLLADGTPVYRVVVGQVLPLGLGITTNPAAAVEGILTASEENMETQESQNLATQDKQEESHKILIDIQEKLEKQEKELISLKASECVEEKNSQNLIKPVINSSMKLKETADITDDLMKEISASDLRDFIKSQIKTKDQEWQAQEEVLAQEKEAAQLELESEKEKAKTLSSEVEELKALVSNLQEEKETKEKQEIFNDRMASLTEEYELSAEQSKAVASQIKDLSEESFDEWKKNFEIFTSVAKVEDKVEEVSAEVQEISEELIEEAKEVLASVEATEIEVPNSSEVEEAPSDFERYAKAFARKGEQAGVKISK